jgi:hypothetical protein
MKNYLGEKKYAQSFTFAPSNKTYFCFKFVIIVRAPQHCSKMSNLFTPQLSARDWSSEKNPLRGLFLQKASWRKRNFFN